VVRDVRDRVLAAMKRAREKSLSAGRTDSVRGYVEGMLAPIGAIVDGDFDFIVATKSRNR
jgi:hypothetical protein